MSVAVAVGGSPTQLAQMLLMRGAQMGALGGGLQQGLHGLQQGLQGLQQLMQPLQGLLQNPLGAGLSAAGKSLLAGIGMAGQGAGGPLGQLTQGLNSLAQGLEGLGQALGGLNRAAANTGMGGGKLGGALGAALDGVGDALNTVGALKNTLKSLGLDGGDGGGGGAGGTGGLGGSGGLGRPMTIGGAEAALAKGMLASGKDQMTPQDFEDGAKGVRPRGMRPQDFTPEFQQACQTLQNSQGGKRRLDTADADTSGKGSKVPDGTVGIGDLSAALQNQPISQEQRDTVATLRENFRALSKDGSGTFDNNALKQVRDTGVMPDGKLATPELQKACGDFLKDPALSFSADNAQKISEGHSNQKGDGNYSLKDLDLTLAR